MRPIPKVPKIAPITAEDIAEVERYLKDAIAREHEQEEERIGKPFVCTFALDWQSEDRHVIERITRFDLAYVGGQLYVGDLTGLSDDVIPIECKEARAGINQYFELLVAGIFADFKGWLNVPQSVFLRPVLEKFKYDRDTFVLWEGCGALFITFLSNADSDTNEQIMHNDVFLKLKRYEPFLDCRENDDYWRERNEEWNMKLL